MDDERELEVIRHDMEQTRESLAGKIEALENTFQEKVEGATEAVTSTVEAVQETVQTVKETVTETFNLSAHVRNRPWLMVGGAVALGCLGGYLLGGSRERASTSAAPDHDYTPVSPALSHNGSQAGNGHAGVSSQEEEESNSLSEGLKIIQGLAVGALMGLLREAIAKAIPNEWEPDVSNVVDNWTTRLGGKPLRRVEQPAGSRFTS